MVRIEKPPILYSLVSGSGALMIAAAVAFHALGPLSLVGDALGGVALLGSGRLMFVPNPQPSPRRYTIIQPGEGAVATHHGNVEIYLADTD